MHTPQRVARFVLLAAAAAVAAALSLTRAAGDEAPRQAATYPRHILLIRHAEKTGDKDDVHLSAQGKKRAELLGQLFAASKERPDPFPTPDFVFAARAHKDSLRPVETVTPLARTLKLPIDDRYDSKLPAAPNADGAKEKADKPEGMAELRAELFGSPKYQGKTILVAWRHSTISKLAQTLGARDVPEKWDDAVFDRVWQLTYDPKGNVTFRNRPQRLLPGDAEK